MWPYWLMFLVPATVALFGKRALRPTYAYVGLSNRRWTVEWLATALAIALLVGLRWQVGGDWGNYFVYLEGVEGSTFKEVLLMQDPGYQLANWLSGSMGWGIFGVNLICGVGLSAGLIYLCRSLPRPWLALTVAVPYLVIVVGMGYSRQGVALGLAMLGMVALQKRSTFWFVVWVLLGASFHKSALLLLPISALANSKSRYWTLLWVGVVTIGAYQLLLEKSVESLLENYIEAKYQSEGALVRLLMNALPAVALLVWRKRFNFSDAEKGLWTWISVISLVLLGVLFVSPSSTAVDRIALYMLPLQLVVFAHLPDVLGKKRSSNQGLAALVVVYYALVQFVWLNFAVHASGWLPYSFYPLVGL